MHHHTHDEPLAGLAVPGLAADEEEEAVAIEEEGGVAVVEREKRVGGVAFAVGFPVHNQHRVVLVLEIYMVP